MRLSSLQKFVLTQAYSIRRARVLRKEFLAYYRVHAAPPNAEDQQTSLTKSLERLIDKGLMVGYGRRTPRKWFIDDVRLTAKGRRVARQLFGKQQELPLKQVKKQKPPPMAGSRHLKFIQSGAGEKKLKGES